MRVRSLELRTTLMVNALYGLTEDRGNYIVVRTPSVPDYWYGNCLAMPGPPRPGDLARWEELFAREHPGAAHRVFLMDAPEAPPEGEAARVGLAEFAAAGYELSTHDVLATDAIVEPPRLNGAFSYRPLAMEREWAAAVEASWRVNEGRPGFTRGFIERKFAVIRAVVERGRGAWWAAWADSFPGDDGSPGDDGLPVASMGLFWGDGLVRFQDVETDPAYRRRGICRSLLYRACLSVGDAGGGKPPLFVIKPEDDSVRRIYEAVGFRRVESSADLFKEEVGRK